MSYEYDNAGNLVSFTNTGGAVTRFEYDNDRRLTEIIDPRGVRASRNEYDENGRLIAIIDADGNRTEFENDIARRRSVTRDCLGNSTVFLYDDWGNILSVTDAMGNTVRNEYDSNGNMSSQTEHWAIKRTLNIRRTAIFFPQPMR